MTTPHVLIVDDDPALLQALPHMLQLRMDDVAIDTVDSARQALDQIAAVDYDAIVSDIKMPGMDGLALLAEISNLRPNTPTLLITGHGEHNLAVQALRGGAYDFIQKPIDRDYFVASLTRAIQVRRLSRQIAAQQLQLEQHAGELEQTVQERTRELVAANQTKDKLLEARDQALRDAEVAQQRLVFLAEASKVLSASLDFETTLANIAQLAVPYLADWCFVDLVGEDLSFRRLAVAHADPTKADLAHELRRYYAPLPTAAHGVSYVAATNQPELIPEVGDDLLGAIARDEQHLHALRELHIASYMCVPLVVRDQQRGTISFLTAESQRRYNTDDLVLAEDIVARAALAVENARLYQEAQEAVRARDEFLSIASHELKTPLTSLQLQIDSLLLAANGNGFNLAPERLLAKLEAAERQSARLTKLVNELLDISRIINGRIELEIEDVELVGLVQETVARFNEELALTGGTMQLHAQQPIVGRFDRFRMEQIVTNLLSNAIKYGRGKPIEITLTTDGTYVQLAVRDQGIGIAPEHQERIFARFERAVSSRHYGGLGLGLYIVRQILDALGGSISVASEPDVGSTFTVVLPLAGPAR